MQLAQEFVGSGLCALEKQKAASGDVQAARELRENHDHYYGCSATGEHWPELLGAGDDTPVEVPEGQELATVRAVLAAAIRRYDDGRSE